MYSENPKDKTEKIKAPGLKKSNRNQSDELILRLFNSFSNDCTSLTFVSNDDLLSIRHVAI